MEINLDILEDEHLIGKLKLLELQNIISPFRNSNEPKVERRLSQALLKIPTQYQEAAIALYASTIYVTEDMLLDSWKFLWSSLKKKYSCKLQDVLLLELDRDLIRDEFYHANRLVGRLEDNLPWRSTHDIIDALMSLEENPLNHYKQSFSQLRCKDLWILLIDMSVSGSSAISEIERTKKIIKLLCEDKEPRVVTLFQVITEEALNKLNKTDCEFFFGLKIPLSCAFNSESYDLISNSALKKQASELCDWFAQEYVLPSNSRISKLAKEDFNIAKYGYGTMGWNIVTYKNTPNNSLPLLWFKSELDNNQYLPPFERIDSRISKSWEGRTEFMKKVSEDNEFQNKIRNILNSFSV